MYAVIKAGGSQHVVHQGDRIRINKHQGDKGEQVTFDQVLLLADGQGGYKIGTPLVAGAAVKATVTKLGKGPKLRVGKYRPHKNERKVIGHAQPFTELTIDSIHG